MNEVAQATKHEMDQAGAASDAANGTQQAQAQQSATVGVAPQGGQAQESQPGASGVRARAKRVRQIPLQFFAPTVEEVAVIGSWAPGEVTPLERGEGGAWQVTLPLADGSYTYRFRTRSRSYFQPGKEVTVVDPEAREIERHEGGGPEDGDWGVLTIRRGRRVTDTYRWRHDDVVLPRDRELVIYELHVGDFSGGPGDEGPGKGRFTAVIEKLPYLKELGINAIELLPLQAEHKEYNWGYIPIHFFAPKPEYGTPAELKALVDACHAQGIRVIADMVCNHANVDTPLAQIDHDYWFYHTPPAGEETYGPKFNLGATDPLLGVMPARKFLNEMLLYWAVEYHLDGIRFDATKLINNFDFLGWIGARLKEEEDSKPFLLIAEHLPVDPSVVGYNGPVDSAWHDPFYFNVTATLRGQDYSGCHPFDEGLLKGIDPALEGFEGPRSAIQYLENHDHDRLLYALARAGIEGDEAFRRATLGATLLLTAVGIPMIFAGGEFGMACAKTPEECKLNWASLGEEPERRLHEHYRRLIELRERTPSLHSGHLEVMAFEPEWHRLAYRRWASEHQGGGEAIILANAGDTDITDWEVPNWPARGRWREVGGAAVEAGEAGGQQVIAAGQEVPPGLDLATMGDHATVKLDVPRWSARIFLREDAAPEG